GTTFTLTAPLNYNHVQGAPVRRIGFPSNTSLEDAQPAPVSPYPGASLLMSNVVSFQVQVLYAGNRDFTDVGNFNLGTAVFDTALTNNPYMISAIQVTIRVWDPATLQTRQITVLQEM